MAKDSTLAALALGAKPASNTPCPHTPLKNAWCSVCAERSVPATK